MVVDLFVLIAQKIGTDFSDEVSESMSIDSGISAALNASFFRFFEAEIGLSANTGYDWTHTSTEAMSETEEFFVQAVADPRKIFI